MVKPFTPPGGNAAAILRFQKEADAVKAMQQVYGHAFEYAGMPPKGISVTSTGGEILVQYERGNPDHERWGEAFVNAFQMDRLTEGKVKIETCFRGVCPNDTDGDGDCHLCYKDKTLCPLFQLPQAGLEGFTKPTVAVVFDTMEDAAWFAHIARKSIQDKRRPHASASQGIMMDSLARGLSLAVNFTAERERQQITGTFPAQGTESTPSGIPADMLDVYQNLTQCGGFTHEEAQSMILKNPGNKNLIGRKSDKWLRDNGYYHNGKDEQTEKAKPKCPECGGDGSHKAWTATLALTCRDCGFVWTP